MLEARILDLIATVIGCCEGLRETAPGHPPAATVRVVTTLRQFLREGTVGTARRACLRRIASQWRILRASESKVSGSPLRRAFERWPRIGLLQKVHASLVAVLRGNLAETRRVCG